MFPDPALKKSERSLWLGWHLLEAESSSGLLRLGCGVASHLLHSHAERSFFGEEAQPQPLLEFLATRAGLHDRLLLILTAIVVAPISEELIFRGYIFGVLRHYVGRWWAMVISALVFAAIHAHIPSLAGLFVLAVTLTLVYENAGSLWASIVMHALFNSFTVILTLAWPNSLK